MTDKTACFRKGQRDTLIRPTCQPHASDRDTSRTSNLAEDAVVAVAVTVPLAIVFIALVMWFQ